MPRSPTLEGLCRHALARSLFRPATLPAVLRRLGFVQADPIRAPARAQDLILRQRVAGYRAGELERRYPRLSVEEDCFVNYGFVPREIHRLMHPRTPRTEWPRERRAQAQAVLEFVRARGVVHPAEVDAAFDHGRTRNWFGGSSRASTQLLDGMHYRGLLRVARREGGVRLYAEREDHEPADRDAALDRLADVVLTQYAPLPERSLSELVAALRYGAPQWADARRAALARLLARSPQARVGGVNWVWPAGENPMSARHRLDDSLRLLAPFDPVAWDRRRFEIFWGWAYRFEAYTPAAQRVRGYYALPLLWRGRVDGWANLALECGALVATVGWQHGRPPRDGAWRAALEAELARTAVFLGLDEGATRWQLQSGRAP
jgi:uncharacterized protein YcaQ